jgi:ubiquinone/menaquinone biosynthesis C-methylase UbiE
MNRGNARANAFAVEQLGLQQTDRVLEIGFGGGMNLERLLAHGASITGVDRSKDSVAAADRRFAAARAAGRAHFVVGEIEALPFPDDAFTKALTVHTVYFWSSLDRGFDELYRCLEPGGVLSLGFLPKARMDRIGMPDDLFTPRDPDALAAAASKAGFDVDRRQPQSPAQWMVFLCRKPGASPAQLGPTNT